MFGLAKSNSLVTPLLFKTFNKARDMFKSVFELSRKPVLFLQVDIFMGIFDKFFFYFFIFHVCYEDHETKTKFVENWAYGSNVEMK